MKEIPIKGLEKYTVNEYGEVFCPIKNKWVRPVVTIPGYVQYSLFNTHTNKIETCLAHRLVALAYIPNPNNRAKHVRHIDLNRSNNHISNLKWDTKTNIMNDAHKANMNYYDDTRPLTDRTSQYIKSSGIKGRKITLANDVETLDFNSLVDAAKYLNTYRKKLYRAITNNTEINGHRIQTN